jgi:hypothetical protein
MAPASSTRSKIVSCCRCGSRSRRPRLRSNGRSFGRRHWRQSAFRATRHPTCKCQSGLTTPTRPMPDNALAVSFGASIRIGLRRRRGPLRVDSSGSAMALRTAGIGAQQTFARGGARVSNAPIPDLHRPSRVPRNVNDRLPLKWLAGLSSIARRKLARGRRRGGGGRASLRPIGRRRVRLQGD